MRNFSEEEIYEIWQKHVLKDDHYYSKYEILPMEMNQKNWRWEGKDFPRIWTILDFNEWIEKYGIKHFGKVLATCYNDPELEYITYDSIDFAIYENGRNDLHTLNLPEKNYDMVIISQTIEHLYNPFTAMQRLFEHIKPGGYLFTCLPTINIPHMTPFHFNGYTPTGLCMLLKSVGFEILEVGFWGNTDYIERIFRTGNWPDYQELSTNGIIKNERDKNVQCWALVRKM